MPVLIVGGGVAVLLLIIFGGGSHKAQAGKSNAAGALWGVTR